MKNGRVGDTANTIAVAIASLLIGAMVIVVAGCSPAPTAPDTGSVPVACVVELTGAAAGASQYPFATIQDYLDYFNEDQGIEGVTVELAWVDCRTQQASRVAAYHRFIEHNVPVMLMISGAEIFKTQAEKNEIPILGMAQTESIMYPPGWIYSVYPTWAESFAVWCEWILKDWMETRPPRVTVIGPDAVAGAPAIEPARDYVEAMGIEMLPTEYVSSYTPLDASTQLLRMAERGTDFVFIAPIFTTAVPVLRDAERLGLKETIQFGGLENTQSEGLLKASAGAADGYTAPRTNPFWKETDIPGIRLHQDLRQRYGRSVGFQGDEANSLTGIAVVCEALKRAIDEVGYRNLEGRHVKEAMDGLKDFDIYGIKTITYTPDDHRGSTAVRIYRIQGADVIPVSEWAEAPMITP